MTRNIIVGFLFSAVVFAGCSKEKQVYRDTFSRDDGIFLCNVGEFEVYMLVEGTRLGNTSILVGADEELISRFISDEGFYQSTNAFLIKSPNQITMIDTGTGINDYIIEKIKKIGIEMDEIETVLLTHLHRDHYGGLQKDGKAVFPNARIYLSANEQEFFTEIQVNEDVIETFALYDGKVEIFDPADINSVLSEILPGIKPIANYGHTPGHTVYLLENGEDKLLVAGDFLHIELVQFALPEISATYDTDKEAAAVSRRTILDFAARNKIPIGGMHVVYPGIGFVEAGEDGGFTFIPAALR